jgi:hypothetical protein
MAFRRSVHRSPGTCSCSASHTAATQDSPRDLYSWSQQPQGTGEILSVRAGRQEQPAAIIKAASIGQDGDASRARVRVLVLVASETQDRPVSWQDVANQTGLSRSRAYALLREERMRQPIGDGADDDTPS